MRDERRESLCAVRTIASEHIRSYSRLVVVEFERNHLHFNGRSTSPLREFYTKRRASPIKKCCIHQHLQLVERVHPKQLVEESPSRPSAFWVVSSIGRSGIKLYVAADADHDVWAWSCSSAIQVASGLSALPVFGFPRFIDND